ncbi:DNA/RNA nuclease SfsA [Nitrosophilus kaiyonis]|uniref:DNA/RNA nuclease SfsA n=1 Tax=Nitrosophilus kaiyonis TaxID=2930200 RepID=UPI00248FB370|nr:DNA/RNA nuclease SfsA [Nitrosophilus kaiyonis]
MILFDLKTLGSLTIGFLIKRENRFLATAKVNEKIVKVHIADTGRLEEILIPNRKLLLLKNRDGLKTDFTLIAVKMPTSKSDFEVKNEWVLINTKLHSKIAKKAIENGVLGFIPNIIKNEVKYKNSRLDFYIKTSKLDFEVEGFVELKGCSLVENGICLFPNAPTKRGAKHIKDLIDAVKNGFKAYILIMAVRKCRCFQPHPIIDLEFKKFFQEALKNKVIFKGFFIKIDNDLNIIYDGELKLCRDFDKI